MKRELKKYLNIIYNTYIYLSAEMMKSKLTLTLQKDIIKKSKIYARSTGRSLSGLIETYLKTLVADDLGKEKLSLKLKKIAGSVKLPADFNNDNELRAFLENKHL